VTAEVLVSENASASVHERASGVTILGARPGSDESR